MSFINKILKEANNFELVHYTNLDAFDFIQKKGLTPTDKGNLGGGNYFWVSDILSEKDFNADELTLRIKPEIITKYVDEELLNEFDIGDELTTNKIPTKHLEYLTNKGWKSFK